MRTSVLACACVPLFTSIAACGASPAPPPSTPTAERASARPAPFRFAQLGQGCSPIDGLADVYVFTRADRGCATQDGDEVLVVTYWGERSTAGGTLRIATDADGQAQICVQSHGGCVALPEVELTKLATPRAHLRARFADGRVIETDFVLRQCPEKKQLCG